MMKRWSLSSFLSPSSATKSFVPVGSLWSLEDEWSLRMVDRQRTLGLSEYVFQYFITFMTEYAMTEYATDIQKFTLSTNKFSDVMRFT